MQGLKLGLIVLFTSALMFAPSSFAAPDLSRPVTALVKNMPPGNAEVSELLPLDALASSPLWHKLIHYKARNRLRIFGAQRSDYTSALMTDSFFLSAHGAVDPQAELLATVTAMLSADVLPANTHAQCRFPARLIWLRSVAPAVMAAAPNVRCDDYKSWSADNSVDSISLFFATGYLENPASYYGHILMRFNAEPGKPVGGNPQLAAGQRADLLATSLDYGAILEPKDNALVYIVKGMFGGYSAGFTHDLFYKQNHNYGETQLRDLWEYRLDLDQWQRDLIVAHSWELLRNKFTYYFFRNNCAYAMAELVELVVDQPMLKRNIPWVSPQSVFRQAHDARNNGKPLVADITLHESLQSRLYQRFDQLTGAEQKFVRSLIKQGFMDEITANAGAKNSFNAESYQRLPLQRKQRVLDTLISYYQYRLVKSPDSQSFRRGKQAVLIERLAMPPNADPMAQAQQTDLTEAPHHGQTTTTLRVGPIYNAAFDEGLALRFRPAYFDTLSSDIGRPAHSTLAMANLELSVFEDFVQLKRFDLIDLEAFNTSQTGLPGDGSYLWKLNIGVRSQNLACKSCLTTGVEAGLGKAYRVSSLGEYFIALDGRLQTAYRGTGPIALTPRMGFVTREARYGKMMLTVGYRDFVSNSREDDWLVHWQYRIGAGRDWDLRLKYEYDRKDQFGLAVSKYF